MRHCTRNDHPEIRDYGCEPFIFNLRHAATMNENFRTALWTGRNMQLTLMSIPSGGEIGVEMHADVDQYIRVEAGCGTVYTGCCRNNLKEAARVKENYAIFIPAGTWHNVVNCGCRPLKLSSLYSPPQHPYGTVHRTKAESEH